MNEPLSKFAEAIGKNWDNLVTHLHQLAETAEAVHQAFFCLIDQLRKVNADDPAGVVSFMMTFGAHLSWIEAVILTAGAHLDAGLSELRRAIEFTCYAAKVSENRDRAALWINQASDAEALKKWKGQTALPVAYSDKKYALLHPLVVNWDMASDYGSHANLQSLARNAKPGTGLGFDYHAKGEEVPPAAAHIILCGHHMLRALNNHLSQYLNDMNKCQGVIKYAEERVQEMRSQLAKAAGAWSEEARKAIFEDDNPAMERKFQELLKTHRRLEERTL